tara:strand:- start:150 stop:536 length:387 start_codon:yes stop_codon:yes gene_type:complete
MNLLDLKKNDKLTFESEKDLLMYYQTTFRNVGLYTSVSFAALGYSRFYRNKSLLYSGGLIAISLGFLAVAAILNILLIKTLENYYDKKKYVEIQNWEFLCKITSILHFILLFFAAYTLYRMLTGNAFK